jgi:hypothetical protein
MNRIKLGVLALLGCSVSMMAQRAAADEPVPPPAREAQIPFASQTIQNWQIVDNYTVLIQDRGKRWYRATLYGNCIDLSFTQRLSFIPNPSGTFDRFGSIRVRGQRCPLRSLVETSAPPKKSTLPDPAAP